MLDKRCIKELDNLLIWDRNNKKIDHKSQNIVEGKQTFILFDILNYRFELGQETA